MHLKSRRISGFTLLELVIIVAILAVLGGAALVAYSNLDRRGDTKTHTTIDYDEAVLVAQAEKAVLAELEKQGHEGAVNNLRLVSVREKQDGLLWACVSFEIGEERRKLHFNVITKNPDGTIRSENEYHFELETKSEPAEEPESAAQEPPAE